MTFSHSLSGSGHVDLLLIYPGTSYQLAGFFSYFFDPIRDPEPVPEPASMLLLGSGLAALVGRRRFCRSPR